MWKKLLLAAGVAFVALPAVSALADDGFDCCNQCPLAQKAGELRSWGTESVADSATPAEAVRRNLDRV